MLSKSLFIIGHINRVRNWGVKVRENLLIFFIHFAWPGEGGRKNNNKFTDFNTPISDSARQLECNISGELFLCQLSAC